MKTSYPKIKKSNSLIFYISLSLFFFILFRNTSSKAQIIDPLIDIDAQLRALFSPLARPNPSKLYLYDMAAHKVDEKYFCNACADTITTNYWFALYDEMYHSAYDTSTISTGDDVFDQATQIGSDTITMGLMDDDYYTIKDTALNSNLYFDYDTVNTILTDKAHRPGYPYDEHNLFSAAPLWNKAYFTNVVFRIDPDFLFIDLFNTHYYSGIDPLDFKIDFGDGLGYIAFDLTVVTLHTANYHGSGYYYIKTALYDGSTRVKYSVSVIKIMSSSTSEVADEYVDAIAGLNVGIYGPCDGMPEDKFIIYLPGWDPLDLVGTGSRSIEQIYDQQIKQSNLVQLRNFGYSFVVVDWEDSRDDIRINAMYVIDLIKYLKCRLIDAKNHNQQFVVIGESMGGLVARYALTYMESSNYNTEGDCYPEKLHNVRLMITLDTPHQGANVSLSVQNLYHDFVNWGPLLPKLSSVLFKQMNFL